jgi:hypothetical protein
MEVGETSEQTSGCVRQEGETSGPAPWQLDDDDDDV